MKQLLKKLNNFRLTSLIFAAIALFGALVTILFFVSYQTTCHFEQVDKSVITNAFPDKEILGMIFFISAIVAVILGIAVIALALPYIMPKEKGVPNRNLGYVLVAQAVFMLVLIVLGVLVIIDKRTENRAFWIINMVLGLIFVGGAAFMMLPNLRCDFYCPELVEKKKKEEK